MNTVNSGNSSGTNWAASWSRVTRCRLGLTVIHFAPALLPTLSSFQCGGRCLLIELSKLLKRHPTKPIWIISNRQLLRLSLGKCYVCNHLEHFLLPCLNPGLVNGSSSPSNLCLSPTTGFWFRGAGKTHTAFTQQTTLCTSDNLKFLDNFINDRWNKNPWSCFFDLTSVVIS